jgi:hypothetical protein
MAYYNRDPAYVPSQQALAADAYIASTSPETHPDEYTYYPGYGNTYTGPMANYTSGTEYNTWLNSSVFGPNMFGSGQAVADFYNDSSDLENVKTLLNAFPNAQDTATYIPETNFPSLNVATETTATPAGPAYTAADVNALYNQYLNRDAEEAGLNYWLNSLNTGTSLEDVIYNIIQSDEYKSLQGQAGTTNSTEPADSTGLPPVVDNESSGNVLTAAGLANALSMLIPKQTPTPPANTGVMGPSSGGTFNPAPIQTLSFSSPELVPIGSSNQIDYVKQMRAGLFKDLV